MLAVTGSTPRSLRSETPLDRVVALGRVDHLGAPRRLAPQRPAELADEALPVEVDRLAQQRRAVAVLAALAPAGQLAHRGAHERQLRRPEGLDDRDGGHVRPF